MGVIYLALRVIPIVHESVAYTYDQGRDFAAARDIVRDRNLVLIGPTTGMQGVFHGAWWYYFLAGAYVLFAGAPQGFYYFMVLCGIVQTALLVWFIRKEVSLWLALCVLTIVSASPYFIYTSTFASNTILVLPSLLILMYGIYSSFKKLTYASVVCIGVGLGLLLESEVAFGILIMPAVLATYVVTQRKKLWPFPWKNALVLLAGYITATLPRVLFELKYSFMQSKVILNFSNRRVEIHPSMQEIILDRIGHMNAYAHSLFQHDISFITWLVIACVVYGYFRGYTKLHQYEQRFIQFMSVLVITLFGVSLLYTKNPFYGYYYEGITCIFLLLIVYGLHALSKYNERQTLIVTICLMLIVGLQAGVMTYTSYLQKPTPEGLHMHTVAISHVLDRVGKKKFCLRMYTPPAITYTYDYLLDEEVGQRGGVYPYDRYIDHSCWYYIESDANVQRRLDWMKKNIPDGAKQEYEYAISSNLLIQRWSYTGQTGQPEEE